MLDWHRRAARRAAEDLLTIDVVEPAAPDDPAAAALEGISTRAALAVVATLPADQAEAIVLRVVAGLGVDQVAAIMGKRPGTVRVLTHRGLRRLAERRGAGFIRGGVTRWSPTTLLLLRCAEDTPTRRHSTRRPSSGCWPATSPLPRRRPATPRWPRCWRRRSPASP